MGLLDMFQKVSESPTNPRPAKSATPFDVADLYSGPLAEPQTGASAAVALDEKLRQAYFWIVNHAIINPYYDIEYHDGPSPQYAFGDQKSVLKLPSGQSYSSFVLLPLLNLVARKRCLLVGGPGRGKTASAILMGVLAGYSLQDVKRAIQHGQPQMTIEHLLKNTGTKPIVTNVYNHNFMTLDRQPPGPDYEISFPFQLQRAQRGARPGQPPPGGAAPAGAPQPTAAGPPPAGRNPNPPNGSRCGQPQMQALAAAQGNRLVYAKVLEGVECFQASFTGFSPTVADHEIRIENKKVGAGVRIRGDRPMSRFGYWSIRTVLAPEPYIDINVEPGREFTWKWTYDYFVSK